jgi:RNA polymerase sigma-70 factor (ECF subfamily)
VFAIARHTRLDGHRRTSRREAREELTADPPDTRTEESDSSSNDVDALLRVLKIMPDSQRDVILMLKVSGMSLEDVARVTSSTVGAVKQRAHRAYAALRKALERGGGR